MKKYIAKKLTKANNDMNFYGSILFILGILITIIVSFVTIESKTLKAVILTALLVIGILIGVLNITGKETVGFLVSIVALVMLIGPLMGVIAGVYETNTKILTQLFNNLILLLAPAAIVVALKTIVLDAKDE